MKGNRKVKKKRSFFGAAVDVWRYRIITLLIFAVPVLLLDYLTELLADSSGAAITTANMGQFFSWRLPLFIVLSIALVLVFIIF